MYLYINTADSKTCIGLLDDTCKMCSFYAWEGGQNQSETLLKEVDKLFVNSQISKKDVIGIIAFRGPGSYTGVRVGVATANALALAWNVPIWGANKNDISNTSYFQKLVKSKAAKMICPDYQKPPHITSAKRWTK